MKYSLYILCIILASFETSAQVDILFEKISLDDHADISIISSIAQDEYGYIWAATEEGILKYDSHKAYVFNEYNGLPVSFSNKVQNIYVDKNNQIWASSDNKLAKLNSEINEFVEVKIPDEISLIYDIVIRGDAIWLGSFNGLWRLSLTDESIIEQQLKDISVNYLLETPQKLFVGSKKGFYQYTYDGELKLINENIIASSVLQTNEGLLVGNFYGDLLKLDRFGAIVQKILDAESPIYDIYYSEKENKYFVGSDGAGLYVLDNDYKILSQELHDVNDNKSLSSNGIYDLHADSDGQIWIATYGGGINKFNSKGNPFSAVYHIANDDQSITNSFTRAILETEEGNIWYGTKEGLSIYYPSQGIWKHKKTLSQSKNTDIVMALEEDDNFVWVGTYGNGAYKVNKSTLNAIEYNSKQKGKTKIGIDRVYSICKVNTGAIYLGGIGGPLHVIDDQKINSIPILQIRDIDQGPNGEIVVVGRSGVNFIQGSKVELLESIFHENTEFDYSTINCITFENDHLLWIGTNGDGLIRYDIDTKEHKVINMSNGLPSDIIQGIILVNQKLWASTTRGLINFDVKDENPRIEIFDRGDGIRNASFNYGSYERFDDGRLAFGSTEGVILLDLDKLGVTAKAPDVKLEKITVLNTNSDEDNFSKYLKAESKDEINLNYQQNFVKIDFSGIDHVFPDKVKYIWQMNGVNESWSPPTKESNVSFAGLSPGHYTFNVKALNRNGEEGSTSSIDVIISPPWWASNLAYFIYFLLTIGLIIGGILIAKALLTKRNAEEQISFYNNITHELKTPLSILLTKLENASEDVGKIGEVKTTVNRMNNLFDQLLNFNKVSSDYYRDQKVSKITFANHVKLIIDTFQQEIDKKNLSFNFENNWSNEYFYYKRDVLDKISFNLISNAIKYSNTGGAIILKADDINGKLRMTVKDNGIGIPKDQQADILKRYYRARNAINSQSPGTGLGLMIVKNLVEYDEGEISFTSQEGLGSAFTVVLPSLESKYDGLENISDVNHQDSEEIVSSSNKAKILIVEDNDELRIDMVEKLSEHFSIAAARNGTEGLEKAKAKVPDLIITDLIMPEMDGNQLCLELQKDEDTNHIPVFMMTVLNSSTQKVKSIKSGITTYMTKPIDFPFLIAKINSVLEYKQKLRDKYLHETEVETAHKFKDDRDNEFIQKMEHFIINKIKEENISVQDLCKHMGMSRTALYMKLKDMIDMSLQNFIITTRMNHARKLLLKGGVSVKEVAFQVGFNNPKYFSTSFKNNLVKVQVDS